MTLLYKTIQRGIPGIKGGGKQSAYPGIITNEKIQPNEFQMLMAKKSRLSEADVVYFLHCFKELLMEELKKGNIIQTGVLGSFYPVLKYSNSDKTDRVNKSNIKPDINYRPSREMKTEFFLVDTKEVKK